MKRELHLTLDEEAAAFLSRAGYTGPSASAYFYDEENPEIVLVAITDIEPPRRAPGVVELAPNRASRIAEGIAKGQPICPIQIIENGSIANVCLYSVYDGFHRFHLSTAAGFVLIPAIIVEKWNGA